MKMKFCLVKEKMLKIFIKRFKKLCLGDDFIKKRIEWIDAFKGFAIIMVVYEPTFKEDNFFNSRVIKDLDEFKNISDVILVNRNDNILDDVKDKIYTRDLFSRD